MYLGYCNFTRTFLLNEFFNEFGELLLNKSYISPNLQIILIKLKIVN